MGVVRVRRIGRDGEEVEPLERALPGDDIGDLDAGIRLGRRRLGDEDVARIADGHADLAVAEVVDVWLEWK